MPPDLIRWCRGDPTRRERPGDLGEAEPGGIARLDTQLLTLGARTCPHINKIERDAARRLIRRRLIAF